MASWQKAENMFSRKKTSRGRGVGEKSRPLNRKKTGFLTERRKKRWTHYRRRQKAKTRRKQRRKRIIFWKKGEKDGLSRKAIKKEVLSTETTSEREGRTQRRMTSCQKQRMSTRQITKLLKKTEEKRIKEWRKKEQYVPKGNLSKKISLGGRKEKSTKN